MPESSHLSADEWRRINARIAYDEREHEPSPLGPRGRVQSADVNYLGGHLETPETLRPDLDPHDLDPDPEDDQESYNEMSNRRDTRSAGHVPSNQNPRVPSITHLSPDDYKWLKENKKRNKSRRSHSSGYHTNSSGEYVTAHGSRASVTTFGDGDGADIDRAATPFFTPSHTPSHRSLATDDLLEEYGETPAGRAPDSPSPWSSYDKHHDEPALNAVNAVDKTSSG